MRFRQNKKQDVNFARSPSKAGRKRELSNKIITLLEQLGVDSLDEVVSDLTSESVDSKRLITYINVISESRYLPAAFALVALMRKTTNESIAMKAANCLHKLKTRKVTRSLITLVSSPSSIFSRRAAIYALWLLQDRRATPILKKILADSTEDERARSQAAEALGMLPGNKSYIFKYKDDPSPHVRCGVLCGLSVCGLGKMERDSLRYLLKDYAVNASGVTVASVAKNVLEGEMDSDGWVESDLSGIYIRRGRDPLDNPPTISTLT